MKKLFFLLSLLFFWQISPLVIAKTERTIDCKVVGISDGDTLTCLQNRTELKVRLLYIDAPESSQPFGNKAKQALSNLAFKKQVTLQSTGYDKYGRVLAVVYDHNTNVNLKLVEQGMAWAYRQTQPIYEQTQEQARSRKIGLWNDLRPVEPTEWRKLKGIRYQHSNNGGMVQIRSAELSGSIGGVDCSQRLTCKDFTNYSDAERYYRQCNAKRMDGDGDNIPCNSLYNKMRKHQ